MLYSMHFISMCRENGVQNTEVKGSAQFAPNGI